VRHVASSFHPHPTTPLRVSNRCTRRPRVLAAGLFLAALCVLASSPARGQSVDPLVITRLNDPITLDGLSDEPAWRGVTPLRPLQYEPNNGAEPTERTEFLVAYDDDFLYLALRAYDSDPNGIRANTLYRDRLSGDDHFEVILDTYNDNETAVLFNTIPSGRRLDSAISNDASGGGITTGGWNNRDFNTFWDAAVTVNEEGWFAEMRIPFSSLRFQEVDGKVIMGLAMQRKVARKTERLVYPPVRPVTDWAFLKPSLAQKIVLEGIRPGRQLYFTPYALGGLDRQAELNPGGTKWGHQNHERAEIGGDLKYAISRNLALDLTVNTDFAQAEADDQQVNLTRFSLFFPEKRQFFQERAGIFDFRTGGLSRLFHSRRIGLSDDGQRIRLLGGARAVARMGAWDLGVLDMQSAKTENQVSENFGVVRARRQVFNPYSYAGGIVTSRVGTDGRYNVAYGLDGVFRVAGDDYFTFQWAQTADHPGTPGADVDFSRNSARLTAEIERRRREGFGYHTALAWAGADYNPGLGFTQRNDFTLLDNQLGWSWLGDENSPLIWHTAAVRSETYLRNGDRSVESAVIEPSWSFGHKAGTGGEIEVEFAYEDLDMPFRLSPNATVPVGSYWFTQIGLEYSVSHTDLIQWSPSVEFGTFYDGTRFGFQWSPRWYVSKHLELTGEYEYNRVRFPERDERFDAHVGRLRIGTALNTQLSVNAFIQYNSAVYASTANVRLRYNFREGNDLWVVVNQVINTERDRAMPVYPINDNRTVMVKYTHTFHL
jgi:hypothetical protein